MKYAEVSGNCSYAETLDISLIGYLFMGSLPITAIYSIPSTIITYRIVTRMLKQAKSFSSIFYKIFLHDRIVSLLFFLVDVILRIPKTGFLTSLICKIQPGFYLTIVHVLSYYLLYISLYSSIVISIMRVATVIIPVEAAKIQLRLAMFLLPAIYLLPFLTTWFLFPVRTYFAPVDETASLTMAYDRLYPAPVITVMIENAHNQSHNWRNSLVLLFVSIITCVIVLVCFIITIMKWRTLSGRRTSAWNKSEMSLFFTVCSLCVSLCLFCLLQFFFYYSVLSSLSFLARGFVQDIMVFAPSWVFYVTHPSFAKNAVGDSAAVRVVSVL